MSFKEKISKFFQSFSNAKQAGDADFSEFMDEYNERVLKGATSGKSYSVETFEKIWKLVNFSDKEILGINWDEKDRDKIEKQLINLGLKLSPSKSPTLIGFDLEFISGDTVDGSILIRKTDVGLEKEKYIHCSFSFLDKKADKLVEWIKKKYGKSLGLRDEMSNEYCYDWLSGDILITVNLVKLSSLACMTFENIPGYAKVVRGEISMDEFSKSYLKQN